MKEIMKNRSFLPEKSEFNIIKSELKIVKNELEKAIKNQKINAEIFIGGSYAKGTLVKKKEYDIDIFVRFDWKYENLSEELESVIKSVAKNLREGYERLHGSRDYFKIRRGNIIFEIIPVTKINTTKEARNVTDLSYFHVNYVKKNINKKIAEQIAIAKTFCKAQGVYGAESYIKGFSGYALECLLIYYKNFEKMLKELVKVKGRIIIDPAKRYKNEDEIIINLNESKLNNPIVLIDPTWKDRNVLAALSNEAFQKFQNKARQFLSKPDISFFEEKNIDMDEIKEEANRKKAEFVNVKLVTNKQAGDIAGTKLKKFYSFVIKDIEKQFLIIRKEFLYDDKQSANFYLIVKSKGEIVKIGPPVEMKSAVKAFKKANKNTFIKNKAIHSRIKINYSAKRFLLNWMKMYSKKIKEMDIVEFKII